MKFRKAIVLLISMCALCMFGLLLTSEIRKLHNDSVVTEQFLDQNGRTILWRRFNKNDWAFSRYGKLWTELLPDNERLTVNGETYVHWYDCVTDYIF